MGQLDGRVAIVTGAGRGIGRGIALGFAREGADLSIVDRDPDAAAKVRDECAELGASSIAAGIDVTDPDAVNAMVDDTATELGAVDILVNNAGIAHLIPLVEMSVEDWRRMIEVNLGSVFLCTKAVLPTMTKKGYGRIINIGSQLALKGAATMTHYCAAKSGVHGFTRALAYEVAPHGITVNVIAPGPIETDMLASHPPAWRETKRAELPIGRFGRIEEIVPTAVLLASDGGGYYMGSTLNVSGGDVM
jgi:3-oxoacyl-[acyl-carrier protein] reductase